jgi:hypothetical protein
MAGCRGRLYEVAVVRAHTARSRIKIAHCLPAMPAHVMCADGIEASRIWNRSLRVQEVAETMVISTAAARHAGFDPGGGYRRKAH